MGSTPHTFPGITFLLLTLAIAAADQRRHQAGFHSQPGVSFGEVSEADSAFRSLKNDLSRITSIDDNLGNLSERVNEIIKAQVERAKAQQPASQRGGGGSNCPAPFVEVMSECFSLSRTRLPWHHARHYCLGMGGDLATPSFLYALKTYILEREGDADVWVGGFRRERGTGRGSTATRTAPTRPSRPTTGRPTSPTTAKATENTASSCRRTSTRRSQTARASDTSPSSASTVGRGRVCAGLCRSM
nr:uncharacterized protein LOC113812193 [Penaeus vannamei]